MATYKNIDDLLEIIADWQKTLLPIEAPEDKVVFTVLENVNDYIHDLDTADVVEVVRCKDCIYYKESELLAPNKFCYRLMHPTEDRHIGYNFADDDFCSYGKKVE